MARRRTSLAELPSGKTSVTGRVGPHMQIGSAARATGSSPRSLRYYEDEGLIVPGRLGNGYRDYCAGTLDRVALVRSFLAFGLPVRLIREVLSVGELSEELLADVVRYRERLADRIAELNRRRTALDTFLDQNRGG